MLFVCLKYYSHRKQIHIFIIDYFDSLKLSALYSIFCLKLVLFIMVTFVAILQGIPAPLSAEGYSLRDKNLTLDRFHLASVDIINLTKRLLEPQIMAR